MSNSWITLFYCCWQEKELSIHFEAELRQQLMRQAAAHSDHLAEVLKVQQNELQVSALPHYLVSMGRSVPHYRNTRGRSVPHNLTTRRCLLSHNHITRGCSVPHNLTTRPEGALFVSQSLWGGRSVPWRLTDGRGAIFPSLVHNFALQ